MSARRACRRMLRTDIAQQHSIVRQHRQGSLGAPTCDMPAMLLSFACVDCRPLLARLTSPQPAPGQARACARLGQPLRRVHQDAFSPPVSGQPPPQPASHNQCSRTPAETHAWKMATRMQQWSAGGTEQGGLHLLFFGALKLGQRLSRQIDKLGHCLFRQTICRAEGRLLLGTRALVVTRSPAPRAQRAPNLSVLTVPAPTVPHHTPACKGCDVFRAYSMRPHHSPACKGCAPFSAHIARPHHSPVCKGCDSFRAYSMLPHHSPVTTPPH